MMDTATTTAEAAVARTPRSSGEQWSSVEEGMLQALVSKAHLSRRSTTAQWESIAGHLSTVGEPMGLPVRTASACRNKARAMGLIAKEAPPPAVELVQASFAAPEIRHLVADAFERACSAIVKELRGT